MAGKRCLERSIFANTVSQERQFVDKLKLHSSEDCVLMFLMGMRSTFREYNS